jgi:hypothetical protein
VNELETLEAAENGNSAVESDATEKSSAIHIALVKTVAVDAVNPD